MAEIIGKIKVIGDIQTFESGFSKRQIVITSDEQYPSDIPMDFLKDKANILNDYKVGESVKVNVNIKGSEYQGKYYVGLIGWRIEHDVLGKLAPQPAAQTFPPATNLNEDEDLDLPF